MSIIDQILYWINEDGMDFILTVFFSILFFEGLVPHWIDEIKSYFINEDDDPE